MTLAEYNTKLAEYEEGQRILYYDTLNRFNADLPLSSSSGNGNRFITTKVESFDFDTDGDIESLQLIINEVRVRKAEVLAEPALYKDVQEYYDISGGYDGEIDDCMFVLRYKVMKPLDGVVLQSGNTIMRDTLITALGVTRLYTVSRDAERLYLAGQLNWEQMVELHRR